MVKLCSGAARVARQKGHEIIQTSDLVATFSSYSQERLQDTINEFRSECPSIDKLLYAMRPTKKERTARAGYVYATSELIKKIESISPNKNYFKLSARNFSNSKDIAAFLYKICFITARKENVTGEIDRKYYDDNPVLLSEFADFGYDWEIHPAYRWALQPEDVSSILTTLRLSAHEDAE